jgi:hypothetical protein
LILAWAGVWLVPCAAAEPLAEAGQAFAARLAAALGAGPKAFDQMWARGARNETERFLDLRTAALFRWSEVVVTLERSSEAGGGLRVELRTEGNASWEPKAYEVARSFWSLQLDEDARDNRVVLREAWQLVQEGGEWRAQSRTALPLIDIVNARVLASVFPGQDALLAECTYYVRARAGNVASVRFLLDARTRIYDAQADGRRVQIARGNELGSLGLLGYSPAIESSLRFEKPLEEGEETLLKFRLLSPLVHLRQDGIVTTLPIRDGPYRERVWIPSFGCGGSAEIDCELRWPAGAFAEAALGSFNDTMRREQSDVALNLEEVAIRFLWKGDPRFVDFALAEPKASLRVLDTLLAFPAEGEGTPEPLALAPVGVFSRVPVLGFERPDLGENHAESVVRTRTALLQPLISASTGSTRDLTSEIQELLPLDADLMDFLNDVSDDASTDAERGADDRSAG